MTSGLESPDMGTSSMRLRGRDSWQLRVYLGADPETGAPRWLSKTVHGTQRFARRQQEDLVAEAGADALGRFLFKRQVDEPVQNRLHRCRDPHPNRLLDVLDHLKRQRLGRAPRLLDLAQVPFV